MKMKTLILLAMTPVLFTACGNDDSKKSGVNNINKNTNPTAALAICSEDNAKAYQEAVDAVNKATSYFNQDGSLTPAGQMADVNNAGALAKSSCSYFVNNYGPIECKTAQTETAAETVIHGSEVTKNCDYAVKFLESIGR